MKCIIKKDKAYSYQIIDDDDKTIIAVGHDAEDAWETAAFKLKNKNSKLIALLIEGLKIKL